MWPYTDSLWDYVTFEPTETVRSPYDNGLVIVGEIVED